MTHRFLLSLKKWPLAVQQALSLLQEAPRYGEIRDIDFEAGPPVYGRLPLWIIVDGHKTLLCEPGDTYPFLDQMRQWMERCLVCDREGTLHPEILTVDCTDTVFSIVVVHVGWDEDRNHASPVSLLIVVRSDRKVPAVCCFCHTLEIIGRLYKSITDCLELNRSRFDAPSGWWDAKRLDGLSPLSTTDRLLGQIHSQRIEKSIKSAPIK